MPPSKYFVTAERYIELYKKVVPTSWFGGIELFNDMILIPVITLAMFLTGNSDVLSLLGTFSTAYSRWNEWIEFHNLRFEVQRMMMITMWSGGPRISTNDPTYLAYVYADGAERVASKLP